MTLGWYIHHHGRGHLHRFLSVAPALREPVSVLSSLPCPDLSPAAEWVELPLDVPLDSAQQGTVTAGGLLHWAPLGDTGYRHRMAAIAAWIATTRPSAVVVDVSVEVALLVRLLGVPVIWVAQRGLRDDRPHRLAYAAAELIIAPWTRAVETELDPTPTVYVGALSRFDHRMPTPEPDERRVCLLLGFGGHAVSGEQIAAAARATPDWVWEITAPIDVPDVLSLGPDPDVWALLNRAAVVISSASGNAIAEVAAARRPLICLPQERPFAEQHAAAAALADAGLALVADPWPEPQRWPALLEEARALGGSGWERLHDGGAAERFAAAVASVSAPVAGRDSSVPESCA